MYTVDLEMSVGLLLGCRHGGLAWHSRDVCCFSFFSTSGISCSGESVSGDGDEDEDNSKDSL